MFQEQALLGRQDSTASPVKNPGQIDPILEEFIKSTFGGRTGVLDSQMFAAYFQEQEREVAQKPPNQTIQSPSGEQTGPAAPKKAVVDKVSASY